MPNQEEQTLRDVSKLQAAAESLQGSAGDQANTADASRLQLDLATAVAEVPLLIKTNSHSCRQHNGIGMNRLSVRKMFDLEDPVKVIDPSVDLVYRSAFPPS